LSMEEFSKVLGLQPLRIAAAKATNNAID